MGPEVSFNSHQVTGSYDILCNYYRGFTGFLPLGSFKVLKCNVLSNSTTQLKNVRDSEIRLWRRSLWLHHRLHTPTFSRQKKFRISRLKVKVTLVVSIDAKGVHNHEFVPEGQRVMGSFYVEVLKRLKKMVSQLRPGIAANRKLYYNTTPSEISFIVNDYLTRNGSTTFLSPSKVPFCLRRTNSSSPE